MSNRSASESDDSKSAVPSEMLDRVFNALAHKSRRQILICLHARGGAMSAGEIADRFKHSWPTTTRHLGVLELAGVLEVRKAGRHRMYALRTDSVLRAANWIVRWADNKDAVESPATPAQWKELPYATMRNAIAPDEAPQQVSESEDRVGEDDDEE